jgi:hypothetical protein
MASLKSLALYRLFGDVDRHRARQLMALVLRFRSGCRQTLP